jgi:hypothetical protein
MCSLSGHRGRSSPSISRRRLAATASTCSRDINRTARAVGGAECRPGKTTNASTPGHAARPEQPPAAPRAGCCGSLAVMAKPVGRSAAACRSRASSLCETSGLPASCAWRPGSHSVRPTGHPRAAKRPPCWRQLLVADALALWVLRLEHLEPNRGRRHHRPSHGYRSIRPDHRRMHRAPMRDRQRRRECPWRRSISRRT